MHDPVKPFELLTELSAGKFDPTIVKQWNNLKTQGEGNNG
jgi:hypothetical protein